METVISHYVRIDITGRVFDVSLVEETFDLGDYMRAQIKWANDCPYNCNDLKTKNGWSDEELKRQMVLDPNLGFTNFTEKHGDDWFRENLRPKFLKVKSVKLECINAECFLTQISQRCKGCVECLVAKKGNVQAAAAVVTA